MSDKRKTRNPHARALTQGQFKPKVVTSKKTYQRKPRMPSSGASDFLMG